MLLLHVLLHSFFFFTHPPPPEIYPLSLHAALPICVDGSQAPAVWAGKVDRLLPARCNRNTRRASSSICSQASLLIDRKSTRLNSSHGYNSYAVFCLKKKKKKNKIHLYYATNKSLTN